jgi:hypothetical protein
VLIAAALICLVRITVNIRRSRAPRRAVVSVFVLRLLARLVSRRCWFTPVGCADPRFADLRHALLGVFAACACRGALETERLPASNAVAFLLVAAAVLNLRDMVDRGRTSRDAFPNDNRVLADDPPPRGIQYASALRGRYITDSSRANA